MQANHRLAMPGNAGSPAAQAGPHGGPLHGTVFGLPPLPPLPLGQRYHRRGGPAAASGWCASGPGRNAGSRRRRSAPRARETLPHPRALAGWPPACSAPPGPRPCAGCGVGSWEKFAAQGQSEPVKQPTANSIRAILACFAGGSGMAGGKLRAASSVRYRGHGFRALTVPLPRTPEANHAAGSVPVPHLDAASLAQAKHSLARHLGPLAQALVKRAARECHGLPTLYARLAEQVSDPAARQALVQQMAHLRASSGSAAGRASGAGASSERAPKPLATPTGGPAVASLAGQSPAARSGSSAASHAHATSGSGRAAPLSPALLDAAQHLLALHNWGRLPRCWCARPPRRSRSARASSSAWQLT